MAPLHQPTRRPKDSMKSKVYAAERAVAWSDKAKRDLTESEVQRQTVEIARYADKLMGLPPRSHVNVEFQRGHSAWAYRTVNLIQYGNHAKKRWIVCHEVAHLYSAAQIRKALGWSREQADGRSHGREWAALYVLLVGHWCGTANATQLKKEMRARNVRYTAKRIMSEEQRQAAAARLAAHRPTRVVEVAS